MDKVGKLLHIVGDLICDRVYFATATGEIKLHVVQTGHTRTIIKNPGNAGSGGTHGFYGVAYDPKDNKLYFSSRHTLYRASPDGSGIELLLNSMEYETISGLAFDWATGNLNGISRSGALFACKARAVKVLKYCRALLKGQGDLHRIFLDPKKGNMIYSTREAGVIMKSHMDGLDAKVLLQLKGNHLALRTDITHHRLNTCTDERCVKAMRILALLDNMEKMFGVNETKLAPDCTQQGNPGLQGKHACFGASNSIYCERTDNKFGFFCAYNNTEPVKQVVQPATKYDYDRAKECDGSCETLCVSRQQHRDVYLEYRGKIVARTWFTEGLTLSALISAKGIILQF